MLCYNIQIFFVNGVRRFLILNMSLISEIHKILWIFYLFQEGFLVSIMTVTKNCKQEAKTTNAHKSKRSSKSYTLLLPYSTRLLCLSKNHQEIQILILKFPNLNTRMRKTPIANTWRH